MKFQIEKGFPLSYKSSSYFKDFPEFSLVTDFSDQNMSGFFYLTTGCPLDSDYINGLKLFPLPKVSNSPELKNYSELHFHQSYSNHTTN